MRGRRPPAQPNSRTAPVNSQTDVNNKLAPGVYKVDDAAHKLAAGASQLAAALTATAAGNAENNLADGAGALDAGAARLASGAGDLAAGTGQLKGYRGANNSPEAGTGTAALAQALELLEAAASDPLQGLVPLAAVKDKIAKIAADAQARCRRLCFAGRGRQTQRRLGAAACGNGSPHRWLRHTR